jgi:cytochrome c556
MTVSRPGRTRMYRGKAPDVGGLLREVLDRQAGQGYLYDDARPATRVDVSPASSILPTLAFGSPLQSKMEIRNMIRKRLAFLLSAGFLVVLGIAASSSLSQAQDKEESPLEHIMEKVNKHNTTITKGTRNQVNFAKAQKDVEKSAKELVKLAKAAKPIKDAIKKAKELPEAQKKWDEYIDDLIMTSEKLGEVSAKPSATVADAKSAFNSVKKACADCHKDFRVDEPSN